MENPKIRLRSRQNLVVGLKDEATGNGYSMQYNHRSLRRKPLSHKILNTERVEIFGFLGWGFQCGVSRAALRERVKREKAIGETERTYLSSLSILKFSTPYQHVFNIFQGIAQNAGYKNCLSFQVEELLNGSKQGAQFQRFGNANQVALLDVAPRHAETVRHQDGRNCFKVFGGAHLVIELDTVHMR